VQHNAQADMHGFLERSNSLNYTDQPPHELAESQRPSQDLNLHTLDAQQLALTPSLSSQDLDPQFRSVLETRVPVYHQTLTNVPID
jgi:hypothetical protein